jgi:hypothetical protein
MTCRRLEREAGSLLTGLYRKTCLPARDQFRSAFAERIDHKRGNIVGGAAAYQFGGESIQFVLKRHDYSLRLGAASRRRGNDGKDISYAHAFVGVETDFMIFSY